MSSRPVMQPLAELVQDGRISYGIVQPGGDIADGVPIVRVKDVRNGLIDSTSPLRVAPSIAANYSRTTLKGGELLLSLVGTVGEAAVVPSSLAGWNVARAIAVIRPIEIEAGWLRLCFELPWIRQRLTSVLNTTVQSTLNLSDLRLLPIPVPLPTVRAAILDVIGALDDKIAASSEVIRTSALLASTIFGHILADTTPVPLAETARFVNGRAFTKDAAGSGRVVIRIAELNSGIGQSTVYNNIDVADDHLARPGDLLFAWSGSLTVQRWFHPEAIVNQHIFKVIPNHRYPTWLVHQLLQRKLEEFRAIAADKATTMGHIQRRHLEEPVMIPSREGIEQQHALMDGLWHTALSAEQESLKLQELRDTLLPPLMSGKLRVKDAEKQVEEVV